VERPESKYQRPYLSQPNLEHDIQPKRQCTGVVENALKSPQESPLKDIKGVILGDSAFKENTLARIDPHILKKREISGRKLLRSSNEPDYVIDLVAHSLELHPEDIIKGRGTARSIAILLMKEHTGLNNTEIGNIFGGISCSAVTHICKRLNALSKSDKGLRAKIEALKEALSNVKG